jgi:hypothetical protein
MLKQRPKNAEQRPAASIPERKLWQDELRNTPSLGCWGCPERVLCGSLAVAAGLTSCPVLRHTYQMRQALSQ